MKITKLIYKYYYKYETYVSYVYFEMVQPVSV